MAPHPDPDPNPDPSTPNTPADTLTKTAASLAPALELLERFHHRNKNQHRLAKWWAQADMLRRGVRKMLGEVEGAVGEAEKLERAERVGLKKRRGGGEGIGLVEKGRGGGGKGMGMGLVEKRAVFLRGVLGPRAFLAFTQLSADRQFAHLGLMLLGVLAQVDQAVTPFAAGPSDSTDAMETQVGAAAGAQSARVGGIMGEGTVDRALGMAMDTEMGVAVSREEVMLSIEQDTAPLPAPTRPTGQPHPRSISLPINPPSKRKLPIQTAPSKTEPPSKEGSTNPDPAKRKTQASKGGNDEFDNIFGSSEEDTAPAPTKPPKKKKPRPRNDQELAASKEPTISTTGSPPPDKARLQEKKKKKKKTREDAGGDEFDDIFGSLDDGKSKKPKKRKRKKGDEFDDIFGGL